jgi:UDP-glucose 4-epimerase
MYFDNNVGGTVTLLEALGAAGVRRFVFSSSATVYGDPESVPIAETARLAVTNPYGRSKLMVEQVLQDLAQSDPSWAIGVLRYFNPAGAHPSGAIGEDPRGIPNNLMPFVAQVAAGRRERLSVFGGDYPTPDGTGVRDYIHVVDLARGHLAALSALFRNGQGFTVNLGTGKGYSVLEIVRAFEHACGRPIPYDIVARRPGDIATCFANPATARTLLDWRAEKGIEEMCADHWRWQSGNPHGYGDAG